MGEQRPPPWPWLPVVMGQSTFSMDIRTGQTVLVTGLINSDLLTFLSVGKLFISYHQSSLKRKISLLLFAQDFSRHLPKFWLWALSPVDWPVWHDQETSPQLQQDGLSWHSSSCVNLMSGSSSQSSSLDNVGLDPGSWYGYLSQCILRHYLEDTC